MTLRQETPIKSHKVITFRHLMCTYSPRVITQKAKASKLPCCQKRSAATQNEKPSEIYLKLFVDHVFGGFGMFLGRWIGG